ncbi:MAG: nitroreductase/quinone reductase family protein [Candidatus Limnocylindrales bacterium]
MDEITSAALARGGVIDITTTGRTTGEPRRIEIVFHAIDGRIWISGMPSPRRRSWIANLEAEPRLTLHLKGPLAVADLPATARLVVDPIERRRILDGVARAWNRTDLDAMVATSPLIEVTIDGDGHAGGRATEPAVAAGDAPAT